MRLWLAVITLLSLAVRVDAAPVRIRGVCENLCTGGVCIPVVCPVVAPSMYTGDTIDFWNWNGDQFELSPPPGARLISIRADSIDAYEINESVTLWWTVAQRYTEITPPGGPVSGQLLYAKAAGGMCSKDASGIERCGHRGSSLATPLCISLQNLSTGTDAFLAQLSVAGTLSRFSCITSGTIVTAPTIALAECDSSGASCSDNSAALTCDGSGASTTSFAGAGGSAVDADDWMQANITNTPSVTDGTTTICVVVAPTP